MHPWTQTCNYGSPCSAGFSTAVQSGSPRDAKPVGTAVSQVGGYIKGKSATHIAEEIFRSAKELRRAAFLGEGVLRFDSRTG